MPTIDVLLQGIPGRSNHAYLGQASASLIDKTTMIDVGSLARRPLLLDALDEVDIAPAEIEDILLTHVHFDHCDNLDIFKNATVHIYEDELERVRDGDYDWATPRNAADMLNEFDLETFDIGEDVAGFEVIDTPGHTKHHVGFVLEDDLVYGFTGDAVKNTREVATEDPMVLYDKGAAIDTIQRVKDRIDLVIPGHDTPFYIENGDPVATVDVDFSVNIQSSPSSAMSVELTTNRSSLRDLPENVRLCEVRQQFH